MKCEEVRGLLDGYGDGELDLVNHLQIEQHLEGCTACLRTNEENALLRSTLTDKSMYFRAPDQLRKKIRAGLPETESKPDTARWWPWRWMPTFAAAAGLGAIVITGLVFLRASTSSEDLVAKEIVSAHVRSMMMDNHLTDVLSTDQHTVKPWFEGKLDFSPPVIDLALQGFVLTGGRLDYAAGRPVAALVYKRRQHVINLFVFPTQGDANSSNRMYDRQGFNLVHWNRSGMTFWAVSDLNLNELQEFAQDLQN
jgi:anti-sigma factor RsiW